MIESAVFLFSLSYTGCFLFSVSAVHGCGSHGYLSVYSIWNSGHASTGSWKVACICIRLFVLRALRQYDYLSLSDKRVSKISPDNMSDKSPVIPQDQFSQLYHLFVAGAVLGNEVVDVADVELVSLSRTVVLDLLPSTVELLLL